MEPKAYFITLDGCTEKATPQRIMRAVLRGSVPIERTYECGYRQGFTHLAFENLTAGRDFMLNLPELKL